MDMLLWQLYHLGIAVALFCFNAVAQEEFTIGLIWETVPYSGYLKIFHNGKWGGVCPLSVDWGWVQQDVVCKELGYTGANRRGGGMLPGHAPIPWVLNSTLMCNGSETQLKDCQHGMLGDYECPYRYHRFDSVHVSCSPLTKGQALPLRLSSGPNQNEGRVEIYWNNTWGNVYSYIWAHEYAQVICRELGFKYTLAAVQEGYYKGSDVPGQTNDVHCTGNERKLAECEISFWPSTGYHRNGPRGVRCSNYDPAQDLGVRLVHGEGPHEGEVQVFHNGSWGYICNENQYWDNDEAKAVCRELGYISQTGSYSTFVENPAGAQRSQAGDYFLNNIKCEGFESRLSDCKHGAVGQHSCRSSHYRAKVTCARPAYPQEVVRLVGGSLPWEGFVQTYVEAPFVGDWFFVCNEGRMDIADMHVICRQLGYGYASPLPSSNSFTTSGEVPLSHRLALSLDCTGMEQRISDCKREQYPNVSPCSTSEENVAISCSNNLTRPRVGRRVQIIERKQNPIPGQGHVEVFHNDQWWQICRYGWDIRDANVVCRQLGYQLARDTELSYEEFVNLSPETSILSDVDCTGTEANLQECTGTEVSQSLRSNCRDNYATVNCINASERLVDGNIQLVGSTNELEGRVQMYQSKKWWTICDKRWDLSDAFVACRQLGFASAEIAYRGASLAFKGPTANNLGILLDGVYCSGNESRLTECQLSDFEEHACTHEDDVGVLCSRDWREIPTPEFSLRLVDGTHRREGRVEVSIGNKWGSVCATDFDMKAAHVICRRLGLSYAITVLPATAFSEGPPEDGLPVHLCNLSCNGTEDNIERCSFVKVPATYSHSNDIGVRCSDRGSPKEFDVRLTGGSQPHSGQVEIYIRGTWGTLCTNIWTKKEADTICHQMGHDDAVSMTAVLNAPSDPTMARHNLDLQCKMGDAYHKASCWSAAADCELIDPLRVTCSQNNANFPDLRLTGGGKQAFQGRVEIFYANEWWGICPDLWHVADAQVICHQLGYSKATSISTGRISGLPKMDYLLNKVNCSGSEARLSHCDRVYGSHECATDQFAEALCATDNLLVRLTGGRNYAQGRIEVKYNDRWQGKCADFFDNTTAMVICRQLGFMSSLLADVMVPFANYTLPPDEFKIEFLSFQLKCRSPSLDNLVKCSREYGKSDCPSGEYATLKCADIVGVNQLHKLGIVLAVVTAALIIVHLMAYFRFKHDQKKINALKASNAAYTAGSQEDLEDLAEGELAELVDNTPDEESPVDTQPDTKDSTQSTIEMNSSGAVPV